MQNSLLKVQELPVDSQPRERLLLYGAKALSDYELLAILLRTGTKKQSVLNLAQSLLTHFKDLYMLRQVSIEELQEVPGIGLLRPLNFKQPLSLVSASTKVDCLNEVKYYQPQQPESGY